MRTAYGYARASTVDQEETLGIQQQAIERAWEYRFKDKNVAWGGCFTDKGISGDNPLRSRPQGLALFTKLERGDVVIFTKLDRGFRNTADFLDTVKICTIREISLVLLDMDVDSSTPAGRLVLTIMAAVASFERERTSERMLELYAKRKAEGRPCGRRPPYGMKLGGKKGKRIWVADPYTRDVGARIVELVNQGYAIERIYFHFLEHRVKTREKKEWSRNAIERAYQGEVRLLDKERESQNHIDGRDGGE